MSTLAFIDKWGSNYQDEEFPEAENEPITAINTESKRTPKKGKKKKKKRKKRMVRVVDIADTGSSSQRKSLDSSSLATMRGRRSAIFIRTHRGQEDITIHASEGICAEIQRLKDELEQKTRKLSSLQSRALSTSSSKDVESFEQKGEQLSEGALLEHHHAVETMAADTLTDRQQPSGAGYMTNKGHESSVDPCMKDALAAPSMAVRLHNEQGALSSSLTNGTERAEEELGREEGEEITSTVKGDGGKIKSTARDSLGDGRMSSNESVLDLSTEISPFRTPNAGDDFHQQICLEVDKIKIDLGKILGEDYNDDDDEDDDDGNDDNDDDADDKKQSQSYTSHTLDIKHREASLNDNIANLALSKKEGNIRGEEYTSFKGSLNANDRAAVEESVKAPESQSTKRNRIKMIQKDVERNSRDSGDSLERRKLRVKSIEVNIEDIQEGIVMESRDVTSPEYRLRTDTLNTRRRGNLKTSCKVTQTLTHTENDEDEELQISSNEKEGANSQMIHKQNGKTSEGDVRHGTADEVDTDGAESKRILQIAHGVLEDQTSEDECEHVAKGMNDERNEDNYLYFNEGSEFNRVKNNRDDDDRKKKIARDNVHTNTVTTNKLITHSTKLILSNDERRRDSGSDTDFQDFALSPSPGDLGFHGLYANKKKDPAEGLSGSVGTHESILSSKSMEQENLLPWHIDSRSMGDGQNSTLKTSPPGLANEDFQNASRNSHSQNDDLKGQEKKSNSDGQYNQRKRKESLADIAELRRIVEAPKLASSSINVNGSDNHGQTGMLQPAAPHIPPPPPPHPEYSFFHNGKGFQGQLKLRNDHFQAVSLSQADSKSNTIVPRPSRVDGNLYRNTDSCPSSSQSDGKIISLITETPEYIKSKITRAQMYKMQNGLCKDCKSEIPRMIFSKNWFKCRYTGALYCNNCHKNQKRPMPWRLVCDLNPRPSYVCK